MKDVIVPRHGRTHVRFGSDEIPYVDVQEIKVFADTEAADAAEFFKFRVPQGLTGCEIVLVESYVGVVGTVLTIQVKHNAGLLDILSTPLTINAGAENDNGGGVLNAARTPVTPGEHLRITNTGSSAMGLGVIIYYDRIADL